MCRSLAILVSTPPRPARIRRGSASHDVTLRRSVDVVKLDGGAGGCWRPGWRGDDRGAVAASGALWVVLASAAALRGPLLPALRDE